MSRLPAVLLLSAACLAPSLPAHAQREAVKNKAGDASATKTAPPSKTPGGSEYKQKKQAGPEAEGTKTAGVGTMATTDGEGKTDDPKATADKAKEKAKSAFDFSLPGPGGKNLPVSTYQGKVLLIVNLGRKSSYAAQLPALAKLSDTFKDKGLVVIGVPSNDFGDAEPGTEQEVAQAYTDAKLPFLVTERSSLTGVHQLPLFTYLSKEKSVPNDGLHWNYTKFITDRKGKVILRFGPEVAPDSVELQANLQAVLDGTWKPKKEKSAKDGDDKGDDGS